VRVKGSRRPPSHKIEHLHNGAALLTFYENIVAIDKHRGINNIPPFSEIEGNTKAKLLQVSSDIGINIPADASKSDVLLILENHLCNFEYNEYKITVENSQDLEDRVAADVDAWREHTKAVVIQKHTDEVLEYRDHLLDKYAWTLDAGVVLSTESEAAIVAYRKELHELTERPEFPFITTYPDFPKVERQPLSAHEIRAKEMSLICERTIHAGIKIEISGEVLHFSLTANDQTNLATALSAVDFGGAKGFPYHNDGGLCRIYTADEIRTIGEAATQFIIYHRTYCNHLLYHLRGLTDMDKLAAIYYGMELPVELQKSMMDILQAMKGV